MSFHPYARKVRDPARGPWLRLSSLRSCVSSFCWLTGRPYRETLAQLGLTWQRSLPRPPPTDEFLLGTLELLERERNLYLDRLRAFERKRIRAKLHGRRALSKPEAALLRGFAAGVRIDPAGRGRSVPPVSTHPPS